MNVDADTQASEKVVRHCAEPYKHCNAQCVDGAEQGSGSAAEQPGQERLGTRAGAALVLCHVGQHLLDVAAAAHPGRLAAAAALDPGAHAHLIVARRYGTIFTIRRRAASS